MIKLKKEENARKNNGITLIALVITIIVLIILASISIAALTGDNGLVNQANNAKGSTEYQQWDERIDVAIVNAEGKHRNPTLDDVIQQLIDSDIISEESQVNRETGDITTNEPTYVIEGKLEEYISFGPGMVANKNKEYVDKNGDKAIIPAGFIIVPGKDVISEGLVISDNATDTEIEGEEKISEGNQFVWIPVEDVNKMAKELEGTDEEGNQNYEGRLYYFTSTGADEMTNYGMGTTINREPDVAVGTDGTGYDADIDNLNIINNTLGTNYETAEDFKKDLQLDFNKMVKSVGKNKGFYFGRFEMSLSDSSTPQSKSNTKVLGANGISWYTLYKYAKMYKSVDSVESNMIWGSQYDAMLMFLQSGDNGIDVTIGRNDVKNPSGSITGIEGDKDIVKNIFELYGGNYEWTMETTTFSDIPRRAYRSGYYSKPSNIPSLESRAYKDVNSTGYNMATRLTLYIKD